MDERIEHAQAVAPSLVGLPIEDARHRIAAIPDLFLRETTFERGYEQSIVSGRITVVVEAGRVTTAMPE